MPMSVNFMWRSPQMVAAQSNAEKENLKENLSSIGESIFRFKQSRRAEEERQRNAERQAKLDRMNAEDRQRRIDAEDRQRKIYGETSELIRSKAAQRAELVRRREEIVNRINELEQRIGG